MGKLKIEDITAELINERLRENLNKQCPVTLYNTFHGVPINYEAEVAMIHPHFLGLIVHPYQAVCIKLERRTYLETKSIPTLIRAYPVSIDYTNHVVMLKDMMVPKSITTDLFHSWVAPDKAIDVEISSDDGSELTAPLMEIAVLEGNSIRVVISAPKDINYARHDDVGLVFRLERGGNLVQVQGEVHSLTKIRKQDGKRMEVAGKAIMGDEISVLAYIAKREDEIMGTLDKAYQKLRKRKKARKK
ncbi:MAG: hypothetical protein U9R53_09685 [Chloroflexota bacterium]|nr:hypothetical protein [Chloroflexota bacterium]